MHETTDHNIVSHIDKVIIATVTYFDIFEFPLTLTEIWKWQYHGISTNTPTTFFSLVQIQTALDQSTTLKNTLQTHHGFYFLRGKKQYVDTRHARYLIAEKKYKRARLFARYMRFFPFVEFVGVCNSLGYSNARIGSDIDFFVITSPGRIWTTRFMIVWIMKLLRIRPRQGHMQNALCLSFFLCRDHLCLADAQLDAGNSQKPDIYFLYWLSQMSPLYDRGGVAAKLWESNKWAQSALPAAFQRGVSPRRAVSDSRTARAHKAFWERALAGSFGALVERWSRKLQHTVMPQQLRDLAGTDDTRVVLSDHMLKLHNNDRRELYRTMWEERYEQVVAEASQTPAQAPV